MKDFRRLTVWEKAHAVTLATYRMTANFPREELYGISSQMRRCSASVAANIAEGCGRTGNGEFRHFLNTAVGSAVDGTDRQSQPQALRSLRIKHLRVLPAPLPALEILKAAFDPGT